MSIRCGSAPLPSGTQPPGPSSVPVSTNGAEPRCTAHVRNRPKPNPRKSAALALPPWSTTTTGSPAPPPWPAGTAVDRSTEPPRASERTVSSRTRPSGASGMKASGVSPSCSLSRYGAKPQPAAPTTPRPAAPAPPVSSCRRVSTVQYRRRAVAADHLAADTVVSMRNDARVSSSSAALAALAHSYGIATEFYDWRDRRVDVPEGAVSEVLAAMGVDASDPDRALAERQDQPWRRMLPACVVTRQGEHATFAVHVPHGEPVAVTLTTEAGGTRTPRQLDRWVDPRSIDGSLVGEATFEVPSDLDLGYHTVEARSGSSVATTTVIVTPRWLGLPAPLASRRSWGFAAQLYSVRSHASWGVGDLADLADLAVWSGSRLGADFVLVTRCTPRSRWPRWSRPPTCRRPGASSARSTSGSTGSRSTSTCRRHTGDG